MREESVARFADFAAKLCVSLYKQFADQFLEVGAVLPRLLLQSAAQQVSLPTFVISEWGTSMCRIEIEVGGRSDGFADFSFSLVCKRSLPNSYTLPIHKKKKKMSSKHNYLL